MRIAGTVVLYQPNRECLTNIASYLPLLDVLYIADNSTEKDDALLSELCALPRVEYIDMDGNRGIAAALRAGVSRAVEGGYELCLTMDQDSLFPSVTRDAIEARLSALPLSDYGIVGLNFNGGACEPALVEVDCWLTSGNFIVLENYKKIDGFRSELFIDYVDIDLNEQFHAIGKKVAYFKDLSLSHKIGNPETHSFLGLKFTVMNHSPIRYYYRFRNARYLYRKNKAFYRKKYFHDLFVDIPKVILFEKEKRKKLRLIRKGRRDAKHQKMGVYQAND